MNTNQERRIDLSLPVYSEIGAVSLLRKTILEIQSILEFYGFNFEEAPDIDTEENNFDLLNIAPKHPARSLMDTFFLKDGNILRPHTSNIQSRIIARDKSTRSYTIGSTFRKDLDPTHTPMFHQFEVIQIEKTATLKSLFKFIGKFLSDFFQEAIEFRVRSSFFPFTCLSYEIDVLRTDGWLELGGCGMMHPNLFTAQGKGAKIGFALGIGIERLCMIKNKIEDIRDLYEDPRKTLKLA